MNNLINEQKNKFSDIKRDYGNYLYVLQNYRHELKDLNKLILVLNRLYFINQQMELLHNEIEEGLIDFRKLKLNNGVKIKKEMKEKIKNDNKNQEIINKFLPLILNYYNRNYQTSS